MAHSDIVIEGRTNEMEKRGWYITDYFIEDAAEGEDIHYLRITKDHKKGDKAGVSETKSFSGPTQRYVYWVANSWTKHEAPLIK